MGLIIALAAAFGAAVLTGLATVLQKLGAGKSATATSLNRKLIGKLLQSPIYLLGGLLSLGGWGLSLLALHVLPLFAVQAIITSGLVVTALAELMILRTAIRAREWWAIAAVVLGLVILTGVAQPSRGLVASQTLKFLIVAGPVIILMATSWVLKLKHYYSAVILAVLSGLAFSGTAIIGRIYVYPPSFWRLITEPLTWALLAYAVLGLLAITVALQRTLATKVNAISMTTQTVFPGLVGALWFGDAVRGGLWWLATVGTALVVTGCIVMAQRPSPKHPKSSKTH